MKRVYLSRAFGSTPKTVYKRIEHTFEMPLPAEEREDGKPEETETAALDTRRPASAAAGLRVPVLIALAAVLLIVTAVLVMEPGKKNREVKSSLPHTDKAASSIIPPEAAAALPGMQVTLSQAYADEQKVRATADFVLTEPGTAYYFWYDGKTLPAQFPAVEAANQEAIYYINCALSWQEGERQVLSDLASPQNLENGGLSVMMAGAWEAAEESRPITCYAVSVRVNADGTYQKTDVSYAEIPVTVDIAKP